MAINLEMVGKKLEPVAYEYTMRDVMLYALGVGCQPDELEFIYENGLKVLPTFGVIPPFPSLGRMIGVMDINIAMVVHGEQRLELYKSLPVAGKLTTVPEIKAIYDKIKGALVVLRTETFDEKNELVCANEFGIFVRGEGGFGGDRGPSGERNTPPEREPDIVFEDQTTPIQPYIYRLSGDYNPLHADPNFAKIAGFERPILHGLCTFGFVGRAILHKLCGRDPEKFKMLEVRFRDPVYPGDKIITEMWKETDTRYIVRAKTQKGNVVISNAACEIKP